MWKGEWRQASVFDVFKLVIASVLFGLPWALRLPAGAAWNLSICGYLVIVASLAGLLAEADWEREVDVCIGAWLLIAPWILGFSHDLAASLLHLFGGAFVTALVALASDADRGPPWQFRPGAALRAQSFAEPPAAVPNDLASMGVVARAPATPPFARPAWNRNLGRGKSLRSRGSRPHVSRRMRAEDRVRIRAAVG
jgi:SPW repeat